MKKKKYNKEEHKTFLRTVYHSGICTTKPFASQVFEEGIRKLDYGCNPKEVEGWVENLMKSWTRFPAKWYHGLI